MEFSDIQEEYIKDDPWWNGHNYTILHVFPQGILRCLVLGRFGLKNLTVGVATSVQEEYLDWSGLAESWVWDWDNKRTRRHPAQAKKRIHQRSKSKEEKGTSRQLNPSYDPQCHPGTQGVPLITIVGPYLCFINPRLAFHSLPFPRYAVPQGDEEPEARDDPPAGRDQAGAVGALGDRSILRDDRPEPWHRLLHGRPPGQDGGRWCGKNTRCLVHDWMNGLKGWEGEPFWSFLGLFQWDLWWKMTASPNLSFWEDLALQCLTAIKPYQQGQAPLVGQDSPT